MTPDVRIVYLTGTNQEANTARLSLSEGQVLACFPNYTKVRGKYEEPKQGDWFVYALVVPAHQVAQNPSNPDDADDLLLWEGPPGAFNHRSSLVQCSIIPTTIALQRGAGVKELRAENEKLLGVMADMEERHREELAKARAQSETADE